MTLIRCFFFLLIFQFSAKAQWQSLGPTKVNGQEAFWYFHDPMEAFARKYETEIKGDSTFRHWEYYAKFRIGQGLFLLETASSDGQYIYFLLVPQVEGDSTFNQLMVFEAPQKLIPPYFEDIEKRNNFLKKRLNFGPDYWFYTTMMQGRAKQNLGEVYEINGMAYPVMDGVQIRQQMKSLAEAYLRGD